MIPDHELQEDEAVKSQHSRRFELLPYGSNSEDTNSPLDQDKQSGDIEIVKKKSRQPKRMKTEQDVETQEPTSLRYVVEDATQTEAVEEEVQKMNIVT